MTVGFNPMVSNNRNKIQKQNFCAVVPKYIDRVVKAQKGIGGDDNVIRDITDDFLFKDISLQDANDTLDAVKKILPESMKGTHKHIEDAKNFINFKK